MREVLGSIRTSHNSVKFTQDKFGQGNILGIPFKISGGERIKAKDNIYDLTPEIYKILSSTSYKLKTMKNENDILLVNNIMRD